mgnify:CR=1 FL=1
MLRKTSMLLVLSAAMLSLATRAGADEVLFKNGDRLTGKVTSAAGGKLTIVTAVAGTVTVNLDDVKTFSTEEPIELHLTDGSVLKQKIEAADEGQIRTAGSDAVAAQAVAINKIQKVNPPPVKWAGTITASGLITRGNSNTENVGLSINTTRRAERDRITLGAGYLYGRQEDPDSGDKKTTTDNWYLLGKYDYFFSQKLYGFAMTRIERDRIAQLDLRLTPSAGLGYQWIEKPDMNFSTEAGLAWVYEDFRNADSDDHFAARLAYHFDKKLNDRVSIFHNLEYVPSVEDLSDFNIVADAGLRASLTASMFGELKLEWRHDATPAPGAEKDDLRYILGVGWTF